MIKINLIPQIEKTKKVSQVPSFFYVAIVIILALVAGGWMFQKHRISSVKSEISTLEESKKELKPQVESLEATINDLQLKVNAINELAGQERLLWSKKLNALSDLVPENVKFTHVYIEVKDTKKYLKIEGVSYSRSGEERVALIAKLLQALKTNKTFYEKASGEPNFGEIEFMEATAKPDKLSGWLVCDFTIQMEIL
jgi:Tfp pilus assembly protein PilN